MLSLKNIFKKKNIIKENIYGRNFIREWAIQYINKTNLKKINILDIGCGNGDDLYRIKSKSTKKLNLYGIEIYKPYIKKAKQRKIKIFNIDIEKNTIPVKNKTFDIVIANQILEHIKEIFWVISEISRVLKPGGILIIGIPNLAALHNRILLLIGRQPSTIKILGPHVRGFTFNEFKRFIEYKKFFKILEIRSNFFPYLPRKINMILGSLFPSLSYTMFFLTIRTNKKGKFISILNDLFFETSYFKGKKVNL